MSTVALQKSESRKALSKQPPQQQVPLYDGVRHHSFSGFPIQTKLTIGSPNDKYEREADAMANRIMRMPMNSAYSGTQGGASIPGIQTKCAACAHEEEQIRRKPLKSTVPNIQTKCAACENEKHIHRKPLMMKSEGGVPKATAALGSQLNTTKGSGHPLSSGTNQFMSHAFGTDFSHVRVHTDGRAQQMNRSLNARAFTHGSDIYFSQGEYNPNSSRGKRLLGHELTHVVQQGDGLNKMIQRSEWVNDGGEDLWYETRDEAESRVAYLRSRHPDREFRITPKNGGGYYAWYRRTSSSRSSSGRGSRPSICGRPSTKVSGFPRVYIDRVDINLNNLSSGMTIHWSSNNSETRTLGNSFAISPGAGLCNLCCDQETVSRRSGSLCTPKGDSTINRYACQLSSTSWAKNASFFELGNSRSGIAIHSGHNGHVPSFPASHGCVRTTTEASRIIYDNSRLRHTQVHVHGTWNGNRCYPTATGDRRSRRVSERCGSSSSNSIDNNSRERTGLAVFEPIIDLAGPA